MPGNEVGDRVHNFFGQENLSQGQHHSQVVDGNWPGLGNNLWVGNQRQIGAPHFSNLKNYNVQQSDSERGHGGQSSHMPHGLNFTQSSLRPEFARNQPQNQEPSLNGYVHGHQVFQTRHNEANFLGVDTESDRHNLRSRGASILDSQLGNAPELHMKNSVRLETTESPINYDFFGGQQQMSSQHPNMMQSLPRQQSGITDMQILQHEVMLRQMEEFQRQQQLLQQEARQPGSVNQVPFIAKQSTGNHSPSLINGIPMHDASNYSWQPELVAANTNWLQRGASPVMQGSSSGLMFSPEQGRSLHMMGLVPQQGDQSLYGVPISSNRGTSSQYSQVQMGKPAMPHILASSNSLPGNQYETLSHQLSVQDGTLVSRHGFQGKNMLSPATGQELNSGLNFENLQQVNPQQSSSPMQEFRVSHNVPGSSETSQEKTVMQVAPSQNVATLDPTEEKILFGSDDSLWGAFGRNSVGTGLLDGDFLGACPSVQSGSWSALMQSAVAETSSGDVGIQEEWSGLNFQNTEAPSGNQQLLTVNDRGKQQSIWADTNLQTTMLPSKRFPSSDDAATSINVSGVQQLESKILHEQNERPQVDSSQGFIKQFPEEASNWVDRGALQKPLTEGSNIYGNIPHSSDAELNTKSISGSWTHQKNLSSYNTGSQPSNRTNGWNFCESISAGGGAALENHETENSLRPPQTSDSNNKSVVHEEMGHGAGIWKNDSVPNISVELEHVKSATGSPQIIRKDSNMNNAAAMPNSSSARGNHESSQQLPNSHNIDFWKHVDSLGKSKGSEVPGNLANHLDNGPQILESSGGDNGQEKDKKENSNDSFRSNVSHHTWLDASDSRTLPGFKQKSSGHGRKTVTRKFQYHPMGDLDVDVDLSYGTKHVPHSQAMPQQVSRGLKGRDEGYFGQSKFISHIARNSMEIDKGDMEGLNALPSKSTLPGYAPNETTHFNKPVGTYISNETGPSSQNMLELLHKVDQSSERGTAKYYSYSERNLSLETPETDTSDGSVGHLQGNQSTASQGFALQLGPPSQRLPVPDYAFSSQSSSQTVNSRSSTLVTSEVGEQGRTWLAPTASQGEVRNNIPVSSGQNGNKASHYNIQGNISSFTTGFSYSRSHPPNQLMTGASGQGTLNQSVNVSYDGLSSRSKQIGDSCGRAQPTQRAQASLADPHGDLASLADMSQASGTNQNHARDSAQKALEAVSFSQPYLSSGMSQRGAFSTIVPNAWSGISNQPHLSGAQPGKASNLFKSHLQSNNNSETTSAGSPMIGDQDARKGGNGPSDFGSGNSQPLIREEHPMKENHWQQVSPENNELSQKPKSGSQGKESAGKQIADSSFPKPATTQRDIEAFGRSLRANNFLNQNYSLLHQVQATKNVETDPSNRSVKRFKGPDSGLDAQQESFKGGQQLSHEFNTMARDAIMNHSSVPSEDSKLLSFSSKPVEKQDTNAPSQDMLAFGQKDSPKISRSNGGASVRGEQSHISPQMAPSWFDQYGTFKNGQNVAIYDPRKIATVKSMEQPFIVAKPPDSLLPHNSVEQANAAAASQLGNLWKNSTATSIASENLSSLRVLSSDVADQRLAFVRPKKRKSATCELIPWHKEVTQDLQRLQNISTAEVDWAQAANRLIEKVEDEAEIIDDGPSLLRRKRRLILTTQLMQQLLHPPLAVVLTADASSHYESVAYVVARSTLGDACCTISAPKIYTSVPTDCGNHLSEKLKTSERNDDQHFSKATEEIIERARKLENDLLRLDKRASIIDLRVECQDLEKFSVINRFAKFHSRGQAEGAETSSSSNATANTQKSYLQRYVTALPMPRNLPDRVQCHSI